MHTGNIFSLKKIGNAYKIENADDIGSV